MNYDATIFSEINAMTGTDNDCKLAFSDGSGFTWKGGVSASVNEGSVDAVLEMTVYVTPSTVPVWSKTLTGS